MSTVGAEAVDIRGLETEDRRERVGEEFGALEPGEEFVLVSDRDPTPVRRFLADVAGAPPGDFEVFEVRQATPDDWVLRAVRPEPRRVSDSSG